MNNEGSSRPHTRLRNFFNRSSILRTLFDKHGHKSSSINGQEKIDGILYQTGNIQANPPKGIVKEYQTSDGNRVRRVGLPNLYDYSKNIYSNGKPSIRGLGNIRPLTDRFSFSSESNTITLHREPLADIMIRDNQFKVILELPFIRKEYLKMNISKNSIEVMATDEPQRKYQIIMEVYPDTHEENIISNYNNGILEISIQKN